MYNPNLTDTPTLAEVRSALSTAAIEAHQLRSAPAEQRSATFQEDLTGRINFIKEYDVIESALAKTERAAESESRGPSAAFDHVREVPKGFSQQVTEHELFRSRVGGGFADSAAIIEMEGSMFQRALLSEGTFGENTGFGDGNLSVFLPRAQPIVSPLYRQRLFVRDLMTVMQTTFASVPYIQELNPYVNEYGASGVAEGSAKPEVIMQAVQKDAPIRKIAAWVPVTTELLDDAPVVRGYIDSRLTYMLALREEWEIINGNGVTPRIQGILGTVGVQTQAVVSSDYPATIALAIGKIENVDGDANGIATNPLDYWQAIATRHATQFDNGFGGNQPAGVSGFTWGLPVVRTRALSRGTALVGDWKMGATLLDRQQTTIKVGNQHSDYFVSNKVVILAEERIGIQTHRPDWFCSTSVPTS